jgi:hypothetical protein
MKRWDLIPQETTFWRRSIYEKVGGIDSSFRFAMDFDLFSKFMNHGRLRRADRFFGAFRQHVESKTSRLMATIGTEEVERVWNEQGIFIGATGRTLGYLYSRGVNEASAVFAQRLQHRPGILPGLGWNYDRRWERANAEAKHRDVRKTALITGITGQDGSYLAELLLGEGYRVVGMTRRTSTDVHERIQHIYDDIEFVSGDLLDQSSITSIVARVRPDEVYNLAAQSFVPTSWDQPVLTGEFTALGVTRVLEAIRAVDPAIRFYQAPRCSARFRTSRKTRRRRSTRARPTAWRNSTATGSRSTIASPTISTPSAGSCSTMSRSGAAKSS